MLSSVVLIQRIVKRNVQEEKKTGIKTELENKDIQEGHIRQGL